MSDRRKEHEIRKKEIFERGLSVFFKEAASVNNVYAGTSFLLQFYSFYESIADGERKLSGETLVIWQEINRLVRENFLSSFDGAKREESAKKLFHLRGQITGKMQVLTTYTDRFSLYEYMLNRIEPRFLGEVFVPEDDEAAREILRYIFMEKDNLLVNTRIQQMLSQLPVRMSRGKFESLVRAGFENYVGMDTGAADDFVYRIVSVAGLYEPEGMEDYFPDFSKSLSALKERDWREMGEADYREAQELFSRIAGEVQALTDDYYSLMELVNFLYAWLLNYPYASVEATAQMDHFLPLLEEICAKVSSGEEILNAALLDGTEGVLEEFSLKLQKMQGTLSKMEEDVQKSAAALMLEKEYTCLRVSALLLSGSLFAALEPKEQMQIADRAYLKAAADSLVEKLLTAFSLQPQILNRAMIAAVLGELPVFFNSQNEVMDYVRGSLSGCHEMAEKVAGIRLMRKLMEE